MVARPFTIREHREFTALGELGTVSEPLQIAEDAILADRRASRRVRVTCPASLQTMTTMTYGNLADISESGAKFEADEPPGKGATALLKWGDHEAVCTIIWHDENSCGVWFKDTLSAELVAETAAKDRVLELPIASVGNIMQGRKRSAGFIKRAEVDEEVATSPASPSALETRGSIPFAMQQSERGAEQLSVTRGNEEVAEGSELNSAVPESAKMSDVIRAAFRFPKFGRRAAQEHAAASEAHGEPLHHVGPPLPDELETADETSAPDEDALADAPIACDDPVGPEAPEIVWHEVVEAVEEASSCEEGVGRSDALFIEKAIAFEVPKIALPSASAEESSSVLEPAFGRSGGLPPPTIGHSPTLAEVLRRNRETGDWES